MMTVGRRTARRQAVFTLYQQDLLKLDPQDALQRKQPVPTDDKESVSVDEYATELVLGVNQEQPAIDARLAQNLADWTVERLGVLERAILRVAAYEILWRPDVPGPVAVDEAVALAKRFCSDEAGALVNGVLAPLLECRKEEELSASESFTEQEKSS